MAVAAATAVAAAMTVAVASAMATVAAALTSCNGSNGGCGDDSFGSGS